MKADAAIQHFLGTGLGLRAIGLRADGNSLSDLLPRRIGPFAWIADGAWPYVAIGAAVVACGCWILGARFTRPIIALVGTLGGAGIGYQSPHWFGWSIDPWAVAVLCGLVLGLLAFMSHAYLAAAGLGVILAGWAVAIAAAFVGWPPDWDLSALARGDWSNVGDLQQILSSHQPVVILMAGVLSLIGGTALGITWRRAGVAIFWSMIGVTLGMMALLYFWPGGVDRLFEIRPEGQAAALAAVVLTGVLLQWRLAFHRSPAGSGNPPQTAAQSK